MAQLENVRFIEDVKLHLVKLDSTKKGTPRVSFCFSYLGESGVQYLWNSVAWIGEKSPEVFAKVVEAMLPEGDRCPRFADPNDAYGYVAALRDRINTQKLYAKVGTNERGYDVVYVNRSKRS